MNNFLWPVVIFGRQRRPDDPNYYVFAEPPTIFRPRKEPDEEVE